MKVFLTGGTGFIGGPLARALLGRGWEVVALVRRPGSAQASALRRLGARCDAGDITDRASMRAGMAGADFVVHNAAWYELGLSAAQKARMREINVGGTDNVLGLAMELGVPRTVYVSSVVALGDTGPALRDESYTRQSPCTSAYEQTKTDAHALALEYQRRGLPLMIACPGNVIGVNDHAAWGYFARLYVNGLMPPVGWARRAVFAQASVDDTAEGIALVAERGRPGETYFLAGELVSMAEVMGIWNATPGGFAVRAWMPTALAAAGFALLEPLQRRLGVPAFISRETARAAAYDFRYSNEKARLELGWDPRPAREVWPEILAAERDLRSRRTSRSLAARLNPLDTDALSGPQDVPAGRVGS